MDTNQLIFWIAAAFLLAVFFRRMWRRRMVKNYTARELAERLKEGSPVVLLDVRTTGEHRSGNIKNSLHIPLHELRRRVQELEKHRRQEIICYCQSGSRSLSAAALLVREGFTAANLRGGMSEWNFHHLQ